MMKTIRNFAIVVVLGIAWILLSRHSNPLFLPKPESVIDSFMTLLNNGMLVQSIYLSFIRITIATCLAAVVSIPLGLIVANYRIVDEIITPVTNLMRYIPVTIFYPLLIMWLGIGEQMKVAFLFAATFFFFLPTVILCIKETNMDLVETAYTMGMNKIQVILSVILPSAFPSICQNFLMMYGIGWTYIIIVEVTNARAGLGHVINLGSARGRTDLVFAALFTIMIISWIFDHIGHFIIRKLFPWKFAREIED